jgi:hypothetical protein
MAPRKPKKNIGDQVGGWLGGAAKGVQSWSNSQARTFTNPYINAVGRAVGKNPNLPTSGIKEAVSNTAFAAVDVAAPVIGRAAGKAVTAVGRTVANTGVPARVVNKVTGQKVVVHGSPVSRLTKIEPSVGSNQLPESNVMFGWDPSKKGMQNQITRQAGKFTSKNQGSQVGSLYVTSIKKSDVVTPDKLLNTGQVVSKGSGQVLKEIPASGKSFREMDSELQRQLRRFGAPAKPQVSRVASVVSKTKTKVSEIALTKAQKQQLKNRRIR